MRKQYVPLIISKIDDTSIDFFVNELKKAKIDRVFLCGLCEFYASDEKKTKAIETCVKYKPYFENAGIEIGVWINGFGHGLADITFADRKPTYQQFVGEDGVVAEDCYCPLSEEVKKEYYAFVKRIASEIKPAVLMIDDDYRLNQRSYALGCFCPNHMKDICARLGEEVTREELVEKAFNGGANKYRDAYLQSMHDTLIDFSKGLRKAVDEVYPQMRMGVAMCFDMWDGSGTDGIEIAYALAGNTKPYLRANGAPYWQILGPTWGGMWGDIISAVEYNRIHAVWSKIGGVECISEGDTYPRPRYIIPSNHLEIFDLMLVADGNFEAILKYMYDYRHAYDFEQGYSDRHILNEQKRVAIDSVFSGKTRTGVFVYEATSKFRDSELNGVQDGKAREILYSAFSRAQYPLSHNAISTVYEKCDNVVAVFGENARQIPIEYLSNGVITDIIGAKILTERGVDVGYISSEEKIYSSEYFPHANDVLTFSKVVTHKIECNGNAKVNSYFMPDKTPASYRYENEKGQKFFVLCYDSYKTPAYIVNADYIVDYNRQKQLITAIEWLGAKPLDAVTEKNPYTYVATAKSTDGKMAVGVFNAYPDGINDCKINLDKKYRKIKFTYGKGKLKGDEVTIKGEILPYSFVAFEVKQ